MDNVPIMIISPGFDLLGEIRDYESLQFTRRFYKVGEFELHVNVSKANTDALVDGNLIMLGGQGGKAGIIRHRENEIDENGDATDTLIIKGPTLQGVCAQRIVLPDTSDTTGYDACTGAQETIMKHFVDHHIVNPADANRKIAQVVIAADQQRGASDKWRFDIKTNLADALDTIGEYTKLGWSIALDIANKKWIFDILQGRDLTQSQTALPPVTFCAEWGNIKTPHFIQSKLNASTQAYCGAQVDGSGQLTQQVGGTAGLNRMETYIDCSDVSDVSELLSTGTQKLAETAPTKSFEFGIDPSRPFVYGDDYDLGDTVTAISTKWGIKMDVQITEVKEIYEAAGNSIEPTFGTATPNLISFIKRMVR